MLNNLKYLKTAFAISVGFILFACQSKQESNSAKVEVEFQIQTAKVVRGDITDTIHIYGKLALRQEAWLSSQFDGRLTDFSLLEGNEVKKGQFAGIIVPARREALLQVADSIPSELVSLLDEQEKSISLFYPITGVVLNVLLHTGDVLSKGEHIARIGDLRVLDVQGELPLQYLEMARKVKNMKVQFLGLSIPEMQLPVEVFTGSVSENQSLIVRIKLNNPSLIFRPGMRVKISFPTPVHQQAILLPRTALVEEEGRYFVFSLKDGKTIKQEVTTGIIHSDVVEILSGIEENQQVAIEKVYSLKDNMDVIVK